MATADTIRFLKGLCLWAVLGLGVCALLVAAGYHLYIGQTNDTSYLWQLSQQMMAGKHGLVDISPPLIRYLFLPSVLLSYAGLSPSVALHITALVAVAVSLSLAGCVLRRHPACAPPRRCGFALVVLGVVLLVLSFEHDAFADREFWWLTLALPYMVLQIPALRTLTHRKRLRFVIGCLAGIGFAIKPYYYLLLALIGLYSLLPTFRHIKQLVTAPEHLAIVGVALAYWLALPLLDPTYVYFTLPLGLETYSTLQWTLAEKWSFIPEEVWSRRMLLPLVFSVPLIIYLRGEALSTVAYVGGLLLGMVAVYLINSGFYYTRYPVDAAAFALLVTLYGAWLISIYQMEQALRVRKAIFCVVMTVVFAAVGWMGHLKPAYDRASYSVASQRAVGHPLNYTTLHPQLAQFLQRYLDAYPRFALFSTDIWSINLTTLNPAYVPSLRFHYLWPLPGMVRHQSVKAERMLMEAVAEDFAATPPDMLIVDRSVWRFGLPTPFDILAPFYANSEVSNYLQGYHKVDAINICAPHMARICAYEVWTR